MQGHQILLDLGVKRAVNLTGVARVRGGGREWGVACWLHCCPELITSSGNSADVDYTGRRCWWWQVEGKRWGQEGRRSTFVLNSSFSAIATRSHSVTHTDSYSFLVMIIIIVTKRMVFSIKGLWAKQGLSFFAKRERARGKSWKIIPIGHISSNCHQKYLSKGKY